jgi:hypothetical protein
VATVARASPASAATDPGTLAIDAEASAVGPSIRRAFACPTEPDRATTDSCGGRPVTLARDRSPIEPTGSSVPPKALRTPAASL